jgi:hypothetical protein
VGLFCLIAAPPERLRTPEEREFDQFVGNELEHRSSEASRAD